MPLPNSTVLQYRDLTGELRCDISVDDEPNPDVVATAPVVGAGARYLKTWFPREGVCVLVRSDATEPEQAFLDVEAAMATYSGVKWNSDEWRQTRGSLLASDRTAITATLTERRSRGGGGQSVSSRTNDEGGP